MTILICSGNINSGWLNGFEKCLSMDSVSHSVVDEITLLAQEICTHRFSDVDELGWIPFRPDSCFNKKGRDILSSVETNSPVIWCDRNCSLYLDFWNNLAEDVKFLLFYASPESELGVYIDNRLT